MAGNDTEIKSLVNKEPRYGVERDSTVPCYLARFLDEVSGFAIPQPERIRPATSNPANSTPASGQKSLTGLADKGGTVDGPCWPADRRNLPLRVR